MRLFALTGGIGSGKSAAAHRFQTLGIPVLDADAIGHAVLEPGGPAFASVEAYFGKDILDCGKIDRQRLAQRVFSDEAARRQLNALTHPCIMAEIAQKCAALAAGGCPVALVEAALFGDQGAPEPPFEGLILVNCPRSLRIRRLVQLRGMTEDEVRRRMAAQVDPETKRPIAKWIIENDGDLDRLYAQVDAVSEALHGLAG